jgi:acyl carrier protein
LVSTLDRIRAIAIREFEVDGAAIQNDASFEALGIDSLALVEMVFTVEDEFHIRIPPSSAEKITSINDLVALVDQLVAQLEAPPSVAG